MYSKGGRVGPQGVDNGILSVWRERERERERGGGGGGGGKEDFNNYYRGIKLQSFVEKLYGKILETGWRETLRLEGYIVIISFLLEKAGVLWRQFIYWVRFLRWG